MDTRSERARAVLVGAAYGDALAMPTCGMKIGRASCRERVCLYV